jgi:hypothetical protein
VLSCIGSGLATVLIPRPRSPIYKVQVSELILNRHRPKDVILEDKKEEEIGSIMIKTSLK